MKGWVYIITNKSMPNLLNIGFSTTDPALKAEELNRSEPPYPYVIEYDALVNDPKEVAPKLQAILSYCHENKSWFRCEVAKAVIAVRQAAGDSIIAENNRNVEMKKPQLSKTESEPLQQKVAEEMPEKNLDMQDLYRVAIGEKNCDYYLGKFSKFDNQPDGLKLSWNWSAFLFTGFWALYRKMYLWLFVCWGVVAVFKMFANVVSSNVWTLFYLGFAVVFSLFADSLYHETIQKSIAAAKVAVKDEARFLDMLEAKAGVNGWVSWGLSGVAVLGIVASIAIPKFSNNKSSHFTDVISPSPPTTDQTYDGLMSYYQDFKAAKKNTSTNESVVPNSKQEAFKMAYSFAAALRLGISECLNDNQGDTIACNDISPKKLMRYGFSNNDFQHGSISISIQSNAALRVSDLNTLGLCTMEITPSFDLAKRTTTWNTRMISLKEGNAEKEECDSYIPN